MVSSFVLPYKYIFDKKLSWITNSQGSKIDKFVTAYRYGESLYQFS